MRNLPRMSKYLCFIIVSLLAFVPMSLAAEQLTQVADNIYAYVDTVNSSKDNSFGANAGVVIGADGILVIDTLMSAKEADRFIRNIRSISDKPIKYVVNTHYHLDHSFGNSEFAKLGALIISQSEAEKTMEATMEDTLKHADAYGLTPEDIVGTVPAYPKLTFGDRLDIDLGDGLKVVLLHARYSHTGGDSLVYIPGRKTLFTGDILFTNFHPFLGEGNIPEWTKVLDEIATMDVARIIPGHGPVSTKEDVLRMKDYLLLFDARATEMVKSSDDIKAISDEMLKVLPSRPEGVWLIGPNIQMKYLKKNPS